MTPGVLSAVRHVSNWIWRSILRTNSSLFSILRKTLSTCDTRFWIWHVWSD